MRGISLCTGQKALSVYRMLTLPWKSSQYVSRKYLSSVAGLIPSKTVWKAESDVYEIPAISDELLRYIERTSLVHFSSKDGERELYAAIKFASQIGCVDTEGVEPMFSVHENEVAYLREDEVTEGDCAEELLELASVTVEDLYFSAPPGNVPLVQQSSTERIQK